MNLNTENSPAAPKSRLMSPKEAAAATTLCMPFLRTMADAGEFPAPIKLGVKRIAYVRSEVEAWIDSRIAARTTH